MVTKPARPADPTKTYKCIVTLTQLEWAKLAAVAYRRGISGNQLVSILLSKCIVAFDDLDGDDQPAPDFEDA